MGKNFPYSIHDNMLRRFCIMITGIFLYSIIKQVTCKKDERLSISYLISYINAFFLFHYFL